MDTFGQKKRPRSKGQLKWLQKDKRKKEAKQVFMIKHLIVFKTKLGT